MNTVYTECSTSFWDHYLKAGEFVHHPSVFIGSARQRILAESQNILFFDRIDFYNLSIYYDHNLNEIEENFLKTLQENEILYKMYFRFSIDKEPSKNLCDQLTKKYLQAWLYLINLKNLELMILIEMPHLPHSYIGYLVFLELGLKTLFFGTFPVKHRTFVTDKIENYSLFKKFSSELMINVETIKHEQDIFLEKLKEEFGVKTPKENVSQVHFVKILIIYLRNLILPHLTERLKFNVIKNNQFISLSERQYHTYVLVKTLLRYFSKRFYKKITQPFYSSDKMKLFFGMHYEPELAVHPLAGENHNQLKILKLLSNKIGNKGIIYIKEYPLIFNYGRPFGIIRDSNFYLELHALGNVKFLDYRMLTSKIIPQVDLIVTLAGTIGWEAFLLNVPVLYFGFPWYEGLPCTEKYFDGMNFYEYIDKCKQERTKINYRKVFEILNNTTFQFSVKSEFKDEYEYMNKIKSLNKVIREIQFDTRSQ